jgi:hypothetical protein
MAFVKLDCGILDSTLWVDRPAREVFVTALLMAIPYELTEPVDQYKIDSLETTGWQVPPGWYGFVKAASIGIIRRSGIEQEPGVDALIRLGEPEAGSRSPDFEGRRMVRVEGGFIILNFQKYRDRDYTAADRARRYRSRKSQRDGDTSQRDGGGPSRDITQAEAEAEAEAEGNKNTDMFGGGEDTPRQALGADHAEHLFEVWKMEFDHPRAKLDDKRKKKIQAALKLQYTVADLEKAIRGYKHSPHHMGKNDSLTVYDDIELFLRDAKHIDAGIAYFNRAPKQANEANDIWQQGPNRGIHT